MKKDGFTLVELLAVVIILAIISLFVMPKVADLIKSGNSTNTSIIEQKLLTVARTYTNDYDTRFFNRFVNTGYASIITKDELIDAGLVTSDEVALVEDFRGVRVELLDNNKIKYTIARLGDSNDYTNEELYQMINDLKNDIKTLSSQITNNTTSGNIFLKSYPVGSIYISTSSENPKNIYGGTWEEYGKGRTLVGVDSSDSDFSTVEKLGGEKSHTLTIDEMPSHNHVERMFLDQSGYSSVKPAGYAYYIYSTQSSNVITWTNTKLSNVNYWKIGVTEDKGGSQAHNNLQPYITTYMWKRTA